MKIVIKNGPPAFGDITLRSVPYCIDITQEGRGFHVFNIYGDAVGETIDAILSIKDGECTPFYNAKYGRRLPTYHIKRGATHLLLKHSGVHTSSIFIDMDNVGALLDAIIEIDEEHEGMLRRYRE